jgi:hypothetical protein
VSLHALQTPSRPVLPEHRNDSQWSGAVQDCPGIPGETHVGDGVPSSELQNDPCRHAWLFVHIAPRSRSDAHCPALQNVSMPRHELDAVQLCPRMGRSRHVPDASQYRLPKQRSSQ